MIAGSSWLNGQGVNVYSNGGDGAGGYYQCVELINRLITTRGWSPSIYGNANQLYGNASTTYFDKHPNGSGYQPVPGDIVVWGGGYKGYGHVSVVQANGGGLLTVVEQNSSPTGYGTNPISGSGYVAPTPYGYYVEGFLHAHANHLAGLPPPTVGSLYAGHIVQWDGDRNAQKTAWLVGSDGKRYWIPTIAIYWCLKEQGHQGPDVLTATILDQLPDTGQQASCSNGKGGGGGEPLPHTEPPPSETPPSVPPPPTYAETVGGVTHTWTNYSNAGGTQGPSIPSNTTVQIACKVAGFRVEDGDTWWYRVASSPWNSSYYASADAFYNNGQTTGSLKGTPFVDPAVPNC